jgi:hypothetical protein
MLPAGFQKFILLLLLLLPLLPPAQHPQDPAGSNKPQRSRQQPDWGQFNEGGNHTHSTPASAIIVNNILAFHEEYEHKPIQKQPRKVGTHILSYISLLIRASQNTVLMPCIALWHAIVAACLPAPSIGPALQQGLPGRVCHLLKSILDIQDMLPLLQALVKTGMPVSRQKHKRSTSLPTGRSESSFRSIHH